MLQAEEVNLLEKRKLEEKEQERLSAKRKAEELWTPKRLKKTSREGLSYRPSPEASRPQSQACPEPMTIFVSPGKSEGTGSGKVQYGLAKFSSLTRRAQVSDEQSAPRRTGGPCRKECMRH